METPPFPYKRNFLRYDARYIIQNLRTRPLPRFTAKLRVPHLRAEVALAQFPNPSQEDYQRIDAVTDFFTEDQRMRARVGSAESPLVVWEKHWAEITARARRDRGDTEALDLRETIYGMGIPEANQFKVTLAATIYRLAARGRNLGKLRVLDPCMGWGDRLLAASALGVGVYVGCDPNSHLEKGHRAITTAFAGHCEMIYAPFEDIAFEGEYDIIFTSPPYYDKEIYSLHETQSISHHPTYAEWLTNWYTPFLRKAVSLLAPGGMLVLHVANFRGGQLRDDTLRLLASDELDQPRILSCNQPRRGEQSGNIQAIFYPRR